ncbi:MAG: AraC family transcriptional regulator [Spirosomataceae bacterium]
MSTENLSCNALFSDFTPLIGLLQSGKFPFLNTLITSMLNAQDTSVPKKSYVSKIKINSHKTEIRTIHDNIIRNIQKEIPSLEQVSSQVKLKSGTFSLVFREIYGKPYYTYFLDFKLGIAKDLLSTGQYSVQKVAHLLGYSHPIKLIIPFKKRFSITPGKIKKTSKIAKKRAQ